MSGQVKGFEGREGERKEGRGGAGEKEPGL